MNPFVKRRHLLTIAVGMLLAHASTSALAADVAGTWQGDLNAGPQTLRIVFNIDKGDDGALTTTIDSPDQGAKGIPVSETQFSDGKLNLTIAVIGGSYEGTLSDDGATLDGTWKQGGMAFPLTLKRVDKVEERKRPQNPTKPYPYDEEEVKYENEDAGITLAGTLTLPRGDGPFPAALLITGSGPQDRDEALMGHKPFLVLADHLTRNGIAVLRVDDRGVGESTGTFGTATSAQFATDVAAGVRYLRQHKKIAKTKVGLIGHSEGGFIAPMVAAKDPELAYIVLMAGTGVPGDEILRAQLKLILKASGADDETIRAESDAQDKLLKLAVAEDREREAARDTARQALRAAFQRLPETQRDAMGSEDEFVEQKLSELDSPWMAYFVRTDPRPFLKQVKCPVLAINGEKDLQVPPQQNLPEIEKAVRSGGNNDIEIHELPDLNHLFQKAETGAIAEYGQIEETINPAALKLMSEWILNKTS